MAQAAQGSDWVPLSARAVAAAFVADEAEAATARAAAASLASAATAGQDVQPVGANNPNVIVPLPARVVAMCTTCSRR